MAERRFTYTFDSHVSECKSLKQKAIDRALEKIGGTAETEAKKRCPVDTGRLRASITHQRSTAEKDTMLVGTNVEYAPYVELGHDQEAGRYVAAIGKRLVASHVNGKPFLRPAVEENTARFREIAENELKNA